MGDDETLVRVIVHVFLLSLSLVASGFCPGFTTVDPSFRPTPTLANQPAPHVSPRPGTSEVVGHVHTTAPVVGRRPRHDVIGLRAPTPPV